MSTRVFEPFMRVTRKYASGLRRTVSRLSPSWSWSTTWIPLPWRTGIAIRWFRSLGCSVSIQGEFRKLVCVQFRARLFGGALRPLAGDRGQEYREKPRQGQCLFTPRKGFDWTDEMCYVTILARKLMTSITRASSLVMPSVVRFLPLAALIAAFLSGCALTKPAVSADRAPTPAPAREQSRLPGKGEAYYRFLKFSYLLDHDREQEALGELE